MIPLLQHIREAYGEDQDFDPTQYPPPMDGVYLKLLSIFIPTVPPLKQRLIRMMHDTPYAGHKGSVRTLELLKRNFFWPTMSADVDEYVRNCDSCQGHKVPRRRPGGLLHPVQIPAQPWDGVTMDFLTCLPKIVRGNGALRTSMDKHSKQAA